MNPPIWAFTRKPNKTKIHKAHLMQTPTEATCGRHLKYIIPVLPNWNPEEHHDQVCSDCLRWWRILNGVSNGATPTEHPPNTN